MVLKRLDRAFQSLFHKLAAGGKPCFPPFKSAVRFPAGAARSMATAFGSRCARGWRHGHVTLFGIGRMRMRGIARTLGRICKADVLRNAFGWRLSVVVETDCARRALASSQAGGLD